MNVLADFGGLLAPARLMAIDYRLIVLDKTEKVVKGPPPLILEISPVFRQDDRWKRANEWGHEIGRFHSINFFRCYLAAQQSLLQFVPHGHRLLRMWTPWCVIHGQNRELRVHRVIGHA